MTSVATQSLIDDFTDSNGIVIEKDHFLVIEHTNPVNDVAYSFYKVLDVKSDAMKYGFLFQGNQNLKNVPLENYNVDRSQNATVENFNNIKALYNVYIARGYWKTIFNKVQDDWNHNDPLGRNFHRRMSPLLEQRGPTPPPQQQGGKKEFKNFGGSGKKLTRKNRKYLMKLYRKNRTRRKHRGGGKAGKPGTVSWDKMYWHRLNSIREDAVSQLRNRYGIPEYDEEATKLENLRVHKMAASNPKENIQLVKQLKKLRKTVRNNAHEITLNEKQNEFLDQFYTDTPCCVISGGGKIDDSDGRIRLYKTTEELNAAKERNEVQRYLVNVSKRNRAGEEIIVPTWLTNEEYDKLRAEMLMKIREQDADDRIRTGKTMMNTLASNKVDKDWDLYEAASALVEDKTKPKETMFTGNFHHTRPVGRVAFSDEQHYHYIDGKVSPTKASETSQSGGGKEEKVLPTFESTKTKLKEILKNIPPDDKFSPISKKILKKIDSFKKESFNKFLNIIHKNLDDIMRESKQKGGVKKKRVRSRSSPRVRGEDAVSSTGCPICYKEFHFMGSGGRVEDATKCSGTCNRYVCNDCIRQMQYNRCPLNCKNFSHPDTAFPIYLNDRFDNQYIMRRMQYFIQQSHTRENERQMEEQRERIMEDHYIFRTGQIIELIWVIMMVMWFMVLVYRTDNDTSSVIDHVSQDRRLRAMITILLTIYRIPEHWKRSIIRFFVRLFGDPRVRALRDLGLDNMGGGKKTRRKRYKRKRRTKRKMRKKRGGMKIGDRVEKAFEMEGFNEETGKPTGKKFYQNYQGIIQHISKKKGMLTIKWSDGSITTEQEKDVKNLEPRIDDHKYQAEVPNYIQSSTNMRGDRESGLLSGEYMQRKPRGEMTSAQQLDILFQNSPIDHLKDPKAARALIARLKSGE